VHGEDDRVLRILGSVGLEFSEIIGRNVFSGSDGDGVTTWVERLSRYRVLFKRNAKCWHADPRTKMDRRGGAYPSAEEVVVFVDVDVS
jgi:hypothetical protein